MKAVVFDPGGESRFALVDQPCLAPGAGEAVLDMKAATLNFRDDLIRSNPVSPYGGDVRGQIVGSDGAGVARESVGAVEAGKRYMPSFFPDWVDGSPTPANVARHLGGTTGGILAEQVVMPATALVPVPDFLTDEEAAALPCAGVTAWQALMVDGHARAGQSVLLQGTGGVSILALQIARQQGMRVLITSSSDEKLARAKDLGADVLINYRTNPDWAAAVLDATNGLGVDHVIDVGGEATLPMSLQSLAMGGHLSLIGVLTGFGGDISGMQLRGRQVHIHTVFVGSGGSLRDLAGFLDQHRIRPLVDRTFALDEANEALDFMLQGQHFGKVAIKIA